MNTELDFFDTMDNFVSNSVNSVGLNSLEAVNIGRHTNYYHGILLLTTIDKVEGVVGNLQIRRQDAGPESNTLFLRKLIARLLPPAEQRLPLPEYIIQVKGLFHDGSTTSISRKVEDEASVHRIYVTDKDQRNTVGYTPSELYALDGIAVDPQKYILGLTVAVPT